MRKKSRLHGPKLGFLLFCFSLFGQYFCSLKEREALAQTASSASESLSLGVQNEEVEVGETFRVTVETKIVQEGPGGASADSKPPAGDLEGLSPFEVLGKNISHSSSMHILNGQMTHVSGLQTSFILRAKSPGYFNLTPKATFLSGEKRGAAKTIRVVAKGQKKNMPKDLSQDQNDDPFDQFDPFGFFGSPSVPSPFPPKGKRSNPSPFSFPFPFDDPFFSPNSIDRSKIDPSLSLQNAPDPQAFLYAKLDKTKAVVGEQISLEVLIYLHLTSGSMKLSEFHDGDTSDFLKQSLMVDETKLEDVGLTEIGGELFQVKRFRKVALIPLKAGRLEIGKMTLGLEKMGSKKAKTLSTKPLYVDVREPPLEGRPPAYKIGNTGSFELSGQLSPREVEVGSSISLELTLKGRGHLPSSLEPKVISGVEWSAPNVREELKIEQGQIGGSRSFTYLLKMTRPGHVELGNYDFFYYDPHLKEYKVTSFALGAVDVKGTGAALAESSEELLPSLLKPKVLHLAKSKNTYLQDTKWFFFALSASPVLSLVILFQSSLRKKISHFYSEKNGRSGLGSKRPPQTLKELLSEAKEASFSQHSSLVGARLKQVIEQHLSQKYGLHIRGLALYEMSEALADKGISREKCAEYTNLWSSLDEAHYSPIAFERKKLEDLIRATEWLIS